MDGFKEKNMRNDVCTMLSGTGILYCYSCLQKFEQIVYSVDILQ